MKMDKMPNKKWGEAEAEGIKRKKYEKANE